MLMSVRATKIKNQKLKSKPIKQYEKDTWLRKFLKILGKNHCEEAITEMQKYYYKQLFTKK